MQDEEYATHLKQNLNNTQEACDGVHRARSVDEYARQGHPNPASYHYGDFPPAYPTPARPASASMVHIPPLPRQSRSVAYYGYPVGSYANQGLGISNYETQGSQPRNYLGLYPSSASAELYHPNFVEEGINHLYRQQAPLIVHPDNPQEPSSSYASNVFRPAHFPPETYNASRRRQSVVQNWNYGAGSTLAKSPSFISPQGQYQVGVGVGASAHPHSSTPSMLPARVYNPYSASTPGGPSQTHDAQRLVDQIDLPTLKHALNHWKAVIANPDVDAPTKNLAFLNCETLVNRIKFVTEAISDYASRNPTIGNAKSDQKASLISPKQRSTSTSIPTFPNRRVQTPKSSNLGSPVQAFPSSLPQRSTSANNVPGGSASSSSRILPKVELSRKDPSDAKAIKKHEQDHTSPKLSLVDMAKRAASSGSPATAQASISTAEGTPAKAKKPTTKAKPRKSKPTANKLAFPQSPATTSDHGEPSTSNIRLASVSTEAATPDLSAHTEDSTSAAASSPRDLIVVPYKKTARGTSAGKKKNDSPAPIPLEAGGVYKLGDLIFENDWKRDDDHHVPLKVVFGPTKPNDITYTWSEFECLRERRLVNVTSAINIDDRLVTVQLATLDPSNYTAALDAPPYSQGAVVSLMFAEIFPKAEKQEAGPIYWISYWDVLKVCEVLIDLEHRTLHFKRSQDYKSRSVELPIYI